MPNFVQFCTASENRGSAPRQAESWRMQKAEMATVSPLQRRAQSSIFNLQSSACYDDLQRRVMIAAKESIGY